LALHDVLAWPSSPPSIGQVNKALPNAYSPLSTAGARAGKDHPPCGPAGFEKHLELNV
jgi:hypothetical protein